MVKIRLKRLGRKKRPFYRIVVMDLRTRRNGSPLSELGYYNPLSRELKVDKEAADSWVSKGAQVSPAVSRLLTQASPTGELIVLEKAQKERLSKKAADRQKQEADAKAQAEAAAKEAAAAPPPPAPVEEEVPATEPA